MSQIHRRARRIGELVKEATPAEVRERLSLVADLSRELEMAVYLVGGAVRDLLLTGELRDLDLVVEGSAADFARALGDRLDAAVKLHPEFLTAEVEDPVGLRLDIASSRAESYPEPAALPVVRPGSFEEDLDRRDFTVNTLAVRLGPGEGFELIDAKGGLADLEASLLRILHPRSFTDDPTRAFRAVRLESRLGLRLEPGSERLVTEATEERVFDRLSATRLRQEVEYLFGEIETLEAALRRLDELGLLSALHPRLSLEEEDSRRLARVVDRIVQLEGRGIELPALELWRLTLMTVAWRLAPAEREKLVERLGIDGADRELFLGFRECLESTASELSGSGVLPHRAARALARLRDEEQVLLAALWADEVEIWVVRWLEELRHIQLTISGRDLLARGATPGPEIGAVLEATLEARLDGVIGADEELSQATKLLEEHDRK
ncbi:MAG: CCA tRNA nucleotidyltransferase [Acidobacteria bacterium]|nr:MAG: CCA tRNA nucleotidyltransferase [Acidobacteriota bacterium]